MGVFRRGSKRWIRFHNVDRKWRNAPTGYDVGQEELAEAMHDEVLRPRRRRARRHGRERGWEVDTARLTFRRVPRPPRLS